MISDARRSFCVGQPRRAPGGDRHLGALRSPVRVLQLRPGARGDPRLDEAGPWLFVSPPGAGTHASTRVRTYGPQM